MLIAVFSFWTITPLSVLYASYRLWQPGFSKELRVLFAKRQISTLAVVLITNLYVNLGTVREYKYENIHKQVGTKASGFILVLKILFYFQGILNALIRFSEPFFYRIIWRKIKSNFKKLLCS